MHDTSEHVHVCVPGSKLVQYKVFMAKFLFDYILSWSSAARKAYYISLIIYDVEDKLKPVLIYTYIIEERNCHRLKNWERSK
jgi:hypothetical protein